MLSKKFLEEEIKKSTITIEKIKEGLEVNELIKKAFENALIHYNKGN